MRIAVISDTHDRIPDSVLGAIACADEIWHLGDVCMPAIFEQVRRVGPPVRVVRGNCDGFEGWPMSLDFECEGHRIHLVHIPPRSAPKGTELLLHGHTHVPRQEMVGKTLFLNPGCITRPNRGAPASFAWLELKRNEAPKWSLERT